METPSDRSHPFPGTVPVVLIVAMRQRTISCSVSIVAGYRDRSIMVRGDFREGQEQAGVPKYGHLHLQFPMAPSVATLEQPCAD